MAAAQLNRNCVGSEKVEETYRQAMMRIDSGFTEDMFVA